MHAGFLPYEKLDEPVGFFNYRAADGAFYTKFSEFGSFLHTVYSDAWVDDMLSMDPAPFAEGENDTILTLDGDRGGNIAYCGHLSPTERLTGRLCILAALTDLRERRF